MRTEEQIEVVHANFSRIYLGGIPGILNDEGAFLSFICSLTATEALDGFLEPDSGNGARFRSFVGRYFPEPLRSRADDLWKLRNAAVHGFSPGPFILTNHNGHLHLRQREDRLILNAEDFFAMLVLAARNYFDELRKDEALKSAFRERVSDPDTGVMVVGPIVVPLNDGSAA